MSTTLRCHSILGAMALAFAACNDLPEFPGADRLTQDAIPAEEAPVTPLPADSGPDLSRDAALAGLQAGNIPWSVGALSLAGTR